MSVLSNHINILVMPTDSCNMNCIYCFHSPYHKSKGYMSYTLLQKLYDITFRDYDNVTFIWHGGEPLLMGVDFYRKAIEMQRKYCGIKIKNRMQSNLTLLNENIVKFFKDNGVTVGSSFDGSKNEQTRGFSDLILKNRDILLNHNMSCGFIMVVSRKNIYDLIDSYNYFKGIGANFTPNLYVPTISVNNDELKIEPCLVTEKMLELFDYWINDDACNIHVEYFERMLRFLFWEKKTLCKYNSCLGKWVGIRYNGDIMPCNRFFPKEYSYGNVFDYSSLSQAFDSKGFIKILTEAIARREKCKTCTVFPLCAGGCNNVAYNERGISNNGGESCEILRTIYSYIISGKNNLINSPNPMIRTMLNSSKMIHTK